MPVESLPKLLVVDDDPLAIRLLATILEDIGQVQYATDGAAALDRVTRCRPDLVLLDAEMPGMDGFSACAALHALPECAELPVIFVTAHSDPESESRALGLGAVDFISKPFNAAVVQARVRTHLTLKGQSDRLREAALLLKQANEALQRSNQDLQHFASLAAHDLQAPLNSIAGCTGLLRQECEGKLSESGEQALAYVLDNTRRMQTLIQDLLAYARLDSKSMSCGPTNLGQILGEVTFMLAAQIREAGARLEGTDLPVVLADRQQMSQLLMNLVGNGIKYNQSETPRVRVSARREGNEWLLEVRDNGIGIDPRHHRDIFEIFRRLHGTSVYPGSGIGLAICHRIVTRHGGRIWVESKEGEGSAFYFTLPVADSR